MATNGSTSSRGVLKGNDQRGNVSELAREFGITRFTVWGILKCRAWREEL